MISGVEIALSNKSICCWCGTHINKLEIRGIDRGYFICNKCLNFNKIRKELKEIEEEFIRLNNMNTYERESYLTKLKIINKLK